jgi:hypothetical protein
MLNKKEVIKICDNLKNSNQLLFINSIYLEKFNIINDRIMYSDFVPEWDTVIADDINTFGQYVCDEG